MLKWCLLQGEKMDVKHKLLLFNNLREALIIRVFAPDGESIRKSALIFRGRTGNPDRKIRMWLQSESCPFCLIPAEENNAYSGIEAAVFC